MLAASAGHPQIPYLAEAGVAVEIVDEPTDAERARRLVDAASETSVVWLAEAETAGLAEALAHAVTERAERGEPAPEMEVLPGSYDLPGARLLDLVAVMHRLRSPGGCPWDAKQTHESLLGYLLEEAYETVEAVETGDRDHLREELGDLLLQVMFHARIAEEHPERPYSIDDVAGEIVDKLVHRHPHVFGDVQVADADEVRDNWEVLKAAEKRRTSAVEGVPMGQPALTLAAKLMSRAEGAGLSVELPQPAVSVDVADEQALGAVLLGVVAAARRHDLDAEAALRRAARAYAARIRAAEDPTDR